jgi:hypothetical protein
MTSALKYADIFYGRAYYVLFRLLFLSLHTPHDIINYDNHSGYIFHSFPQYQYDAAKMDYEATKLTQSLGQFDK